MTARTAVFLLVTATLLAIALSTGVTVYYLAAFVMLLAGLLALVGVVVTLLTMDVQCGAVKNRVQRGDNVVINLFLRRRWPLAVGIVGADVSSPEENGEMGHMEIDSVPMRGRQYHYTIRCAHRGVYEIGVTRISVTDIFGLFTLSRRLESRGTRVQVVPRTTPVEPMTIQPGDAGPQGRVRMTEDPASPSGVRTWQEGDGLKKVHWKLSARRRELMVRTFEESARPDLLILMDCAPVNVMRSHMRSVEDVLCETAASAALAQLQAGYTVRIPLNTAEPTELAGQMPGDIGRFLEALVWLSFDSPYSFEQVLTLEMRRLQRTGAVILVTTRLNSTLAELAVRMKELGVQTQYVWVAESVHEDYEALLRRMEFMGVQVKQVNPYKIAA